MSYTDGSSFIRSAKGKVIIAFLAGCIALGLAWVFSKTAFTEMMNRVEVLSAPDEKLRTVNDLFLEITQLSQSQKMQALPGSNISYQAIAKESEPLIAKLDSLRGFYGDNPAQAHRIDSMKSILHARDRLFINYLRVREGLIDGKVLADQMNSLSGLISNTASRVDSTVITTEKTVSTTTVFPPDTPRSRTTEEAASEGLLGKLFGKKKEATAGPPSADTALQPRTIVEEEIRIQIDTVALANQDSLIQAARELVDSIREDQRLRSARFVNREIELLNAGNVLVNEMLSILQEVEREAILQTDQNNAQAREVIHDSVQRIMITMLVFFLVTTVLVYLILTDISRSSMYQEQLEMARDEAEYHSNAKQRFLSNMSHEIRTPLQSIIGYADLLRRRAEPGKKEIEAIYHSSEHLLQIVNEVLDYNLLVSGKFTLRTAIFNVRELLEEVAGAMRGQAEKKGLELRFREEIEGHGYVKGDPFRLKQILYNLLGNAVKFTEEGTVTLAVTGRPSGQKIHFEFLVEDTGAGIPKESVNRIFNQYERAGASGEQHQGVGLGLNIVNILVSKMGGTIVVKTTPDQGSAFRVNLKLAAADVPPSLLPGREPGAGLAGRYGSYPGKVWVVDDDRLILDWCSTVLSRHGIRHVCFDRPEKALQASPEEEVKLILIDIRMPEMDGPELCRRLRARVPEDVKFVALTAQALPEERESVLRQGFDALLMKPFREHELLALLEETASGSPRAEPLDLSPLEAMTFGDKDQVKKILDRFVEDTYNDIRQIYHSLELPDREKLLLLLHRMSGRTAQIGATALAAQFRSTELSLRRNETLEEGHKAEINSLVKELASLVRNIPQN